MGHIGVEMTDQQFSELILILRGLFTALIMELLFIWLLLAIGILLVRNWLKTIYLSIKISTIRYCTRDPGHPNPCNGLPRPDCFPVVSKEEYKRRLER